MIKIMDIPDSEYHGTGVFSPDEYTSASTLKKIYSEPELFFYNKRNGTQQTETAAMRRGTLVHHMLLTPNDLAEEVVRTECKTAAAKEFKASKEAHPKKFVVTSTEFDTARSICDENEEILKYLNKDGRVNELCFYGEYGYSADSMVKMKGKVDSYLVKDKTIYLDDLKTCQDVDRFPKDFEFWHYDMQMAIYSKMLLDYHNAQLKDPFGLVEPYKCAVAIVAVETNPPYRSRIFKVEDAVVDRGHDKVREMLTKHYKNGKLVMASKGKVPTRFINVDSAAKFGLK